MPPAPLSLQAEGTIGARVHSKGTSTCTAHSVSLGSPKPRLLSTHLPPITLGTGPSEKRHGIHAPVEHSPRFGLGSSASSVLPLREFHPFLYVSESPSGFYEVQTKPLNSVLSLKLTTRGRESEPGETEWDSPSPSPSHM